MSMTRQTILASRPAAMVLALSLVAALSAPFVLLPKAHAAATPPTPTPCTVSNHNGCTELSATPPEDTVSVPPNIVLMLDDSGSMAWDYMPDWNYLADNSSNGARDATVNGAYYNPATAYTPPPKADGTSYPDSPGITNAYKDGFRDTSVSDAVDVTSYTGDSQDVDPFHYYESLATTINQQPPYNASPGCGNGSFILDPNNPAQCIYPPTNPHWRCNSYYDYGPTSHGGQNHMCYARNGEGGGSWYQAQLKCQSGTTLNASDGKCEAPPRPVSYDCPHGGGVVGTQCITPKYANYFAYVTGEPGHYTRHYVSGDTACDKIRSSSDKARCLDADDTSGVAAPAGITAGQNVANWFSYYHTRMLLAKSGLMIAFNNLSPKYRFGFGSINANAVNSLPSPTFGFDDSTGSNGTGSAYNKIAEVQPFKDGATGTQRKAFWDWLVQETPSGGTPLRKALNAVGLYYQTQQPWRTMSSDPGYAPGSSSKFACRASYAILTTDGFWNGNSPGIGNADGADGPAQHGINNLTGGYVAKPPFSDSISNTLADVAMYYWERDLQDGSGSSYTLANEVSTTVADPAFWQHMTTFTMGLGFSPTGISGTDVSGNPVTMPEIFAWARAGGGTNSPAAITGFGWPTPSGSGGHGGSENNIADLAHAAVNGHGDFFSVKSPQQLAAAFSRTISEINSRNVITQAAAVNASVTTVGALSFSTSYNTGDWSGMLDAVTLDSEGRIVNPLQPHWKAEHQITQAYNSAAGYGNRHVYTDAYQLTTGTGGIVTSRTYNGSFQFDKANLARFDGDEILGLETPALAGGNDTLEHRIDYLLGDNTYEGSLYRARTSGLLGAIIHSQPVYVSYPSSGYYSNWPSGSPEIATGAESYATFQHDYANRPGTVYVGANDGMLHAIDAPAPVCNPGHTPLCNYGNGGDEDWAFVPRAVYANLGNLTSLANFQFLPTVDATPVTRDVFFSEGSGTTNDMWHTILVGGVGLGGRGVYALDITGTANSTATATAPNSVLWEFDSDMTMTSSCVASYGTCKSSDLGYTISQPNIGRIKYDNKWVVLVPNGYFPDCTTPDTPTADLPATNPNSCAAIAAQAPKDANGKPYSALFVLDAQTGDVIAELKTPTNLAGVTSFGLATPVMGEYDGSQVDQVAFAGDVEGNLWRFDLNPSSGSGPSAWTVTLAYKGLADANGNQGLQPITSMPRLFPDPVTNRFIVMFGTGKYLGVGDNVTALDANGNPVVQAIYGIRDQGSTATSAMAYTQSDLVQQYLSETTPTSGPNAGVSLRCITGSASGSCSSGSADPPNAVPANKGGWFFSLKTTVGGTQNDAGERVVVTPGAIFSSNTAVVQTLITGGSNSDPCNPSTKGSVLFINALVGGPGAGVSSLGGYPVVGARVDNARTSGSLPIVSALGGGKVYVPGATLTGSNSDKPIAGDLPMWRRRSWQPINQGQ